MEVTNKIHGKTVLKRVFDYKNNWATLFSLVMQKILCITFPSCECLGEIAMATRRYGLGGRVCLIPVYIAISHPHHHALPD